MLNIYLGFLMELYLELNLQSEDDQNVEIFALLFFKMAAVNWK